MDNNAINHLNTLLKGEQMAVESYEKFIRASEEGKIKSGLREIQHDHREHAAKLAERIQSIGGIPEYGTGITGVISQLRLTLETKNKNDSVEILKKAYDGEDKGIAMAEKIVKSELDEESKKLLDKVLSADHDHLKSMLSLLTEYGYQYHVQ
ncbi:MAG: DUF2383 domain-containing protein [Ruminiclostridium sp.]|nr:DUF2383 domain-containing protein [Ruminiclostridium sp.]